MLYLLFTPNTQWCLFFWSLYCRARTCYHQILISLSGLPKLTLVLLWLLKLGHHCQTTHTARSDQLLLLLSPGFFWIHRWPTFFSGHQSLALVQLKGHLVRFARKGIVDQRFQQAGCQPLRTLWPCKRDVTNINGFAVHTESWLVYIERCIGFQRFKCCEISSTARPFASPVDR